MKANLLLLENCSFCNHELSDKDIQSVLSDPLVNAVLSSGSTKYDGKPVLFENRDCLVVQNRFPVTITAEGGRHLLVIAKGSGLGHLKKLRKHHGGLLKELLRCGVLELKKGLKEKDNSPKKENQEETQKKPSEEEGNHQKNKDEKKSQGYKKLKFLAGFSYPSEYRQLCLHLIVPPIRNFLLFRKTTWYSYRDVQNTLYEEGGFWKRRPVSLEIDADAVEMDREIRRGIGRIGGTCREVREVRAIPPDDKVQKLCRN